ISTIPKSETILIEGDLNGHVGKKTDGFDCLHGGFGYGELNEDGNRILEFESHEFCLLSIYFRIRKRLEHLITYKSGHQPRKLISLQSSNNTEGYSKKSKLYLANHVSPNINFLWQTWL
ncbi:hypothetical protein HELRODRAFT_67053, partial [Helobdella robusta]|uniref:Endonuclease/exonuclease/phosphatase domain-containing protein n=1 Tax=Helobdella robusta TaxID=6412 RepID=T1FYV7_HELRO